MAAGGTPSAQHLHAPWGEGCILLTSASPCAGEAAGPDNASAGDQLMSQAELTLSSQSRWPGRPDEANLARRATACQTENWAPASLYMARQILRQFLPQVLHLPTQKHNAQIWGTTRAAVGISLYQVSPRLAAHEQLSAKSQPASSLNSQALPFLSRSQIPAPVSPATLPSATRSA